MDFDSLPKLIPLFFLILWWILTTIGKKNKKPERAEKQKKESKSFFKGPLTGKLQDSLNKLFEELELKKGEELPASLKPVAKKTEAPAKSDAKKAAAPKAAPLQPIPPEEKSPKKKGLSIRENAHTKSIIPQSKLQKAVIWSEILARPVGLRDQ